MADSGRFKAKVLSFSISEDEKFFVAGCGKTGPIFANCGQNTAPTLEKPLTGDLDVLITQLRQAADDLEALKTRRKQ